MSIAPTFFVSNFFRIQMGTNLVKGVKLSVGGLRKTQSLLERLTHFSLLIYYLNLQLFRTTLLSSLPNGWTAFLFVAIDRSDEGARECL